MTCIYLGTEMCKWFCYSSTAVSIVSKVSLWDAEIDNAMMIEIAVQILYS